VAAEKSKRELDASGRWPNPVVTEISPYTNFFPAEGYHQNYYRLNSGAPYSIAVIRPKVEKFWAAFKPKG
jgi:peptide-methionine (S)-S-oxide reductase